MAGTIVDQYTIDGGLQSVNSDAMRSEVGGSALRCAALRVSRGRWPTPSLPPQNDAIYNKRVVTIIQSVKFGRVAFVAIGAVCVGTCVPPHSVPSACADRVGAGSINMNKNVSTVVSKGSEVGFFAFGGSTIALVFPYQANAATVSARGGVRARASHTADAMRRCGDPDQVGRGYSPALRAVR